MTKIIFDLAIRDANIDVKLDLLRQNLREIQRELRGVDQDSVAFKSLAAESAQTRVEIKALTDQQKKLRQEFAATTVPKDSLAGLRIEYSRLTAEVNKLSEAERKSDFGKNLISRGAQVKKSIDGIEQSLGRFTGNVGNYKAAFGSIFDIAGGVLLGQSVGNAVNFITDSLTKGIEAVKDYGAALSRLSAITGVTGSQLEEFKVQAETLTTIDVNGQKIVNTATDIFNAFTLVGSARPELLQDADALAEVTKQAIILSKASGDDLDTSVKAITASLAQFDLQASDSADIINLLAAGSKAGKVEIPGLTESITRLGPTAKNSNVSLAETVALFETLADKGLEGERASVQLRNILIKLSSADVLPKSAQKAFKDFGVDVTILKDKTLPLEVRLKELSKVAGDTTALFQIFGSENIDAASILAESVPKYVELTAAVQGTDEAYKQAAIQADNLKSRFENLEKQGLNLLTAAMTGALPILEGLGAGLSGIFEILAESPKFIEENADGLIALGFAVLSLNKNVLLLTTAQGRNVIATSLSTTATEASTVATRALGVAQAALPLLAIIAGIYLAVKAFEAYEESASASEKATRAVADAQADIAKESAKESEALRRNIEILKNDDSKERRKKAIEDLTAAYPEYLRGIDLETASVSELTRLQDQLTASIIRSVAERRKATAQEEIAGKIIDQQLKLEQLRRAPVSRTISQTGFGQSAALNDLQNQNAQTNRTNEIRQTEVELKKLQSELVETGKAFDEAFNIGDGTSPAVKKAAEEAAATKGFIEDVSLVKFGEDKKQVDGEVEKQKKIKAAQELASGDTKTRTKSLTATQQKEAKSAESEAERARKALADQLKRINDLRNSIRELDSEGLPNKFDLQEIEAQNKRLDSLATLEEKRLALANKVKSQGGRQTDTDKTELDLIDKQTDAVKAAYDRRSQEISEAQQQAADEQLKQTRKLFAEVEALSSQNAQRLIEIEIEEITESANIAKEQNQRTFTERKIALSEEFEQGSITRKQFEQRTIDAQNDFNEETLRIEKERSEKSIALSITVKDAKVKVAKSALDAELAFIKESADAEIAAIKKQGVEDGVNTAEQVAAREKLAIEERIAAQQKYFDTVATADKEATQIQIDGINAVNDADLATHEAKLARLEEEKQKRQELQDFLLDAATTVSSAVFEIEKNQNDKKNDETLKGIEAEYEKKKTAAQGNAILLAKLEKEYQQKKADAEKAAAKERKQVALKEAIIAGALAVVKALPNVFAALAAGIAAAAQIAIIASQEFARGGRVRFMGWRSRMGAAASDNAAETFASGGKVGTFKGKRHSQGGIKGYFEDGTKVEVEDDEDFIILNRRASAKYRELSNLNAQYGGKKFEAGGALAFTPQLALPSAAGGTQTIVVQSEATFTDEQMEMLADKIAVRNAEATKFAVGEGLNDANKRIEREGNLQNNREG